MTATIIVPRADHDILDTNADATCLPHDVRSPSTPPLVDSTLIVEPTEDKRPLLAHKDPMKNVGKVAFFGITRLVIAAPALVATPLLGALGFTALGPAAGVAAVYGVVQGTAALGAGANLFHDKVAQKKE
ncbi:hypothetical protein I302_101217 [Kwoniella bestiolae CBS 10118]|uniref:Uncharacterized protein n=1 Tax=Kwoniella bestiolae CBS 10118 TaxID=1296100 RepID=A0A1B9G7D2_9TREE|nr:hypothetical protein I302_04590 [Kwoniella bestiolae CBS 10118]OCF26900.1 hypothetical protein I302_04590 [Kwoniella bestiolae CBS 10118]